MNQVVPGLDPANYRQHSLHGSARNWPETNCYTDVWIEILSVLKLPAEAMLGFTVRQDFEGDQFTFFKPPLEDLESLYDINVTELSIFDDVEKHALTQIQRGRMALVEADSYWLPDTRGVTYQISHGKTTIGINGLDPASKRMTYFHNAGYFALEGDDYEGVFGRMNTVEGAVRLFPYVEFVKLPARMRQPKLSDSMRLLEHHLLRRPRTNPFLEWQRALPVQLDELMQRPEGYFHIYAFNTLRQFGANYDLLAAHLEWLQRGAGAALQEGITAAQFISTSAKAMQFQLARAMARRRFEGLAGLITPVAEHYQILMAKLDAYVGVKRAA